MKKYKLYVWTLVGIMTMGVWTGCNKENPDNQLQPEDRVAVNMFAVVGKHSSLKVANDQWQTSDRLGVFMKKTGETLTADGAVFAEGDNLEARVLGQRVEWIVSQPLYYPQDGTKVDFVAYCPYAASVGEDYSIEADVANQADGLATEILYSNNITDKVPTDDFLSLEFNYSLAKLVVTIESKINNIAVSLEGAFTKAKLQLNDGSITDVENKETITFYKSNVSGNIATYEALILPAVLDASDDMELVFTTSDNVYRYKLTLVTYEADKKYEFDFKITAQRDLVLLGSNITPREPIQNGLIIGKTGKVTTICGLGNDAAFAAGRFGIANFRWARYLALDDMGNIYMTQINANLIAKIDMQAHYVSNFHNIGGNAGATMPNAPCVTPDGLILYPADGGVEAESYYEIDPENGTAAKKTITKIGEPEDEDFIVMKGFKHSFAYCAYDEMVYYRDSWDGALFKFNPATGVGEYAKDEEGERLYMQGDPEATTNTNATDGFLVFDKANPHILYAALTQRHIIVSIDIRTGEETILAGEQGTGEWVDGAGEDARFNSPRQMALDKEGNLIIADANNHCIRKLDLETGTVSTITGFPVRAYRDGDLDKALFDQPFGVAVDKDGSIYIGDNGNRRIRKIWL